MTPKAFWDKDGYLYEVHPDPWFEGWARVVFDPGREPDYPAQANLPYQPIETFDRYKPFMAAC